MVNVDMQDTLREYVALASRTVLDQKEYFTGPMGNDIFQFSHSHGYPIPIFPTRTPVTVTMPYRCLTGENFMKKTAG